MAKEGKFASQRSKPSYVMSIIGVAGVLFLFGVFGLLVINARKLTDYFKENIEIQIILRDRVKDQVALALRDSLAPKPFVKSIEYVDKADAYRQYVQQTHDSAATLLGYNPLYASINFKANAAYVNSDSLKEIGNYLRQSPIVREIFYQRALVDKLNQNVKKVGLILLAGSFILALVAVFLIDNTIRLAMFSNRFLIKTMQMVGATRWFISRPFDSRSIINGLISSLLAVAGIWGLIYFFELELPELRAIQDNLMISLLFLGIILVGISISFFSTHRSVMKYLKMKLDDLY